jgi:hypothetical protein
MRRKAGVTHLGKTRRRRASGEVASGEVASGEVASGEVASGEVATITRSEKKTGEFGAEEH